MDQEVKNLAGKTVAWLAAWLASVSLADVQIVLGILSGLMIMGYTATQWYVLWRDKIRKKK